MNARMRYVIWFGRTEWFEDDMKSIDWKQVACEMSKRISCWISLHSKSMFSCLFSVDISSILLAWSTRLTRFSNALSRSGKRRISSIYACVKSHRQNCTSRRHSSNSSRKRNYEVFSICVNLGRYSRNSNHSNTNSPNLSNKHNHNNNQPIITTTESTTSWTSITLLEDSSLPHSPSYLRLSFPSSRS